MSEMIPTLSIVIPVYNEQETVSLLYQHIRNACDPRGNTYEMVFVDDGSSDDTFNILRRIHSRDSRVKVIRFRRNYGQTAAMAAGFQYARGEVIISMDGDLQNDPADIHRLLGKLDEGYDVVCGWRKDRKDKLISRRLPSMVANWLIGRITGVPIHDNGCSLKAYRAEVIKRVALYSEMHRFIPAMATLAGARITEIVVRHNPRRFGKSKYGISRAWRVLMDLAVVKMLTGFAAKPNLWFGKLSLPVLFVGTACLMVLLAQGVSGVVFPTVAFLCLSLVGHFTVLGVLGEMIVKSGDFRPENMLAEITTKRRQGRDPRP